MIELEDKRKVIGGISIGVLLLILLGIFAYNFFFKSKSVVEEVAVVTKQEEIVEEQVESPEEEPTILPEEFYIDIKGAVKNPGVYLVNADTIVNDAISIAGGLKINASTKYINLAKKVSKEMVLYIYTTSELKKIETPPKETCITESSDIASCVEGGASVIESGTTSTPPLADETSSLININTANEIALQSLSGIGEAKAKAIVAYRTTNGNFSSIEDIKLVSGISDTLYEKIKEFITV